jgi:hypothetical protein
MKDAAYISYILRYQRLVRWHIFFAHIFRAILPQTDNPSLPRDFSFSRNAMFYLKIATFPYSPSGLPVCHLNFETFVR